MANVKKERPMALSNQAKCPSTNPSVLIRKLLHLMAHPISKNETNRQLHVLNQYLNVSHFSFWLQDIPCIMKLYEIIAQKLDTTPDFKTPFKCLLQFSSLPPQLCKNSDKLDFERDFQEYFSTLGYLVLCLPDPELKNLTLKAIKNLLEPQNFTYISCISLEYCQNAIEKSNLPEILSQACNHIEDEVYPALLDVMFMVSQISKKTCLKMLGEDALEYILRRFSPTWRDKRPKKEEKKPSKTDEILPGFEDACCVLWNLLEACDRDPSGIQNPSRFAFESLQYAFRWSNICAEQKMNRNNFLAIILKLLMIFPKMPIGPTGVAKDIELMATTAAGFKCGSVIRFSDDQLFDFQFKKIVWACLHFFWEFGCKVDEDIIVKAFMTKLFITGRTSKNQIEQYCELSKVILTVLPKFMQDSMDVFIYLQGPKRFVDNIAAYLARPYEIEILEAFMKCLKCILKINTSDTITIFAEYKLCKIIVDICRTILEVETLGRVDQKTLIHGFCILQMFCCAGYLSNSNVVKLCISYVERLIHPNCTDPPIAELVTISAVHLLWECILIDRKFYREFLKQNGIYLILDLIYKSPFDIKVLSLGILADVSKKSSCVPYFITWRKGGKKLLGMFLEVFRTKKDSQCCKKIHALCKKSAWVSLCHKKVETFENDLEIKEQLLEMCRFRIHAIIYALKVGFKERVEFANEHYKLFNEKLLTDDELTYLFAEHFLSLRMCRTWLDLVKQLKIEEITPIPADADYLAEKIYRIRCWHNFLQSTISQICNKEKQYENLEELQTYNILKEARLADALDALKELRYISNCTERMFQMRQKMLLQQEVESYEHPNIYFHRTICELPFTSCHNQHISIQSNIIYEKKVEQCNFSAVSSDDDEFYNSKYSSHHLNEGQIKCKT